MRSRLSRLIVLFAMLVCLPLNGVAALTMPPCAAHGQTEVTHASAMIAMPDCDHHDVAPQPAKTPCDQCFSCHVVSAQAIIPLAFSLVAPMAGGQFAAIPAEKPQSIAFTLFRPPILAFA